MCNILYNITEWYDLKLLYYIHLGFLPSVWSAAGETHAQLDWRGQSNAHSSLNIYLLLIVFLILSSVYSTKAFLSPWTSDSLPWLSVLHSRRLGSGLRPPGDSSSYLCLKCVFVYLSSLCRSLWSRGGRVAQDQHLEVVCHHAGSFSSFIPSNIVHPDLPLSHLTIVYSAHTTFIACLSWERYPSSFALPEVPALVSPLKVFPYLIRGSEDRGCRMLYRL